MIQIPLLDVLHSSMRRGEPLKYFRLPSNLILSPKFLQLSDKAQANFLRLCCVYAQNGLQLDAKVARKLIKSVRIFNEIEASELVIVNNYKDLSESDKGLERETDRHTDRESKTRVLRLVTKSDFSLADCLKYVELCQSSGDDIKNARALARTIHRDGSADDLIRATLPKTREPIAEKRLFTDEPCTICKGGKFHVVQGRGAKPCEHCLDEYGERTGYEPARLQESA